MTASLLAPVGIAALLAVIVTAAHRRLPPQLAARTVVVTLGVVLVAAAPTLWIISLGYLAHLPLFNGRLEWCAEAFGVREPIPSWAGLPALAVSTAGLLRARRVLRNYRRLRHDEGGSVEIVEHSRPFAFTLPGRSGHVVLSSGLADLLDDDEQQVVLAHERAHGHHRHDRYLLVAQLASATVPLVRPLTRRLRFSLERWADEAAVEHCGSRRVVALTLGKVALHNVSPAGALSFAGLGVPARVAALLAPPAGPPRSVEIAAIRLAIFATAVLAAFQLHHLGGLVAALCLD